MRCNRASNMRVFSGGTQKVGCYVLLVAVSQSRGCVPVPWLCPSPGMCFPTNGAVVSMVQGLVGGTKLAVQTY
jgi:hypothetical protein